MKYDVLRKALVKKSSINRAEHAQHFFKTGKGEYGEGDIFIGVSVPDVRLVAKNHSDVEFIEIKKLLKSKIHEERLLGGIILVNQFKKSSAEDQKKIHQFFIKNKKSMNNWDLVDTTAPTIIGEYCLQNKSYKVMDELLKSKHHWDRRLAILSTFAFIRKNDLRLTFKYARYLLNDQEDLMHKATEWMLREAGKRDVELLKAFINQHGHKMPRTMLRYSIEKFPDLLRQKILRETRCV